MYHVAMSASSNALEASNPKFSARKEGDVASAPSPLVEKDWQIGSCFPGVNHSYSHPHYLYYVAMSVFSSALEASIPEFSATKEGDVASAPSLLIKSKRLANS